eukprot:1143200-Pelagomonas_calceolata.AAC.6
MACFCNAAQSEGSKCNGADEALQAPLCVMYDDQGCFKLKGGQPVLAFRQSASVGGNKEGAAACSGVIMDCVGSVIMNCIESAACACITVESKSCGRQQERSCCMLRCDYGLHWGCAEVACACITVESKGSWGQQERSCCKICQAPLKRLVLAMRWRARGVRIKELRGFCLVFAVLCVSASAPGCFGKDQA